MHQTIKTKTGEINVFVIKSPERYEMTNTARKAKNAFNRVGVMAGYWAAA